MSLIFETPGIYTTVQWIDKTSSHKALNGPSDTLAHILGNVLTGNDIGMPVIEMTFAAATIQFREQTLIALTGADFFAYTDERKLVPYKIHLMEKGDRLYFSQPKKGTRVYLAVAGGLQVDRILSEDGYKVVPGERIELERSYSPLQIKLFENLQKANETTWGIDQYALSRIYYSDIFHLKKGPSFDLLNENDIKTMTADIYEVTNHFDRSGFVLEGQALSGSINRADDIEESGDILVNEDGELIVSLKHQPDESKYPVIATAASYHMQKLAQKKPGSKLYFKWIDEAEYKRNEENFERWIKAVQMQIGYLHQKELMK